MTDPRWQKIDSAPKDQRVLLFDGIRRTGAFSHHDGGGEWRCDTGAVIHPTHWMPLPDPPAASAEPRNVVHESKGVMPSASGGLHMSNVPVSVIAPVTAGVTHPAENTSAAEGGTREPKEKP